MISDAKYNRLSAVKDSINSGNMVPEWDDETEMSQSEIQEEINYWQMKLEAMLNHSDGELVNRRINLLRAKS